MENLEQNGLKVPGNWLKDRALALGVLLLGIAACLWVVLSWFQFIETSRVDRFKQSSALLRADTIRRCHSFSQERVIEYGEWIEKAAEKHGYPDDFSEQADKRQRESYRDCLRGYGIEAQ